MRKFVLLFSLLVITGCSSQPNTNTIQTAIAQTNAALPMSTPLPTFTLLPTNTPLPTATNTLVPTDTPIPPTATASFEKWTTNQAMDVINSAGLEFENPAPMTKADYGLAPMSAKDAIHFFIFSLCSDCGGRLYSFGNQEDLKLMQDYYENLAKASAAFFSWVFVKDNILININGDLSETKAKLYEAALNNLQ